MYVYMCIYIYIYIERDVIIAVYVYTYIYIMYIYIYIYIYRIPEPPLHAMVPHSPFFLLLSEGGMIRLETLIELIFLNSSFSRSILLLKLGTQFPVEQFEATVSQSTVPSPPLIRLWHPPVILLPPAHPSPAPLI